MKSNSEVTAMLLNRKIHYYNIVSLPYNCHMATGTNNLEVHNELLNILNNLIIHPQDRVTYNFGGKIVI